jgi:hypothetical protein
MYLMLQRRVYNNFNLSWVFSLLIMIPVSVMAESNDSHYPLQLAEGPSNPWTLPPPVPQSTQRPTQAYGRYPGSQGPGYQGPGYQGSESQGPGYQAPAKYYGQDAHRKEQGQHQQNKIWRNTREQFVTPDILESLKQQQQRYQVMPRNQRPMNNRWQSRPQSQQFMQMPNGSGLNGQGAYNSPSYGAGSTNPLYDTPAVSPWGDGADVLYRGESFPNVPNEALGGFPPMHVPSFGMNTYKNTGPGEPLEVDENNVFNPFTFLPGKGFSRP